MAPGRQRLRRAVQGLGLLAFVLLLWQARFPLAEGVAPDLFVRLDPAAALAATVATRQWIPSLWPAGLLLLASLFLGRWFCGWLCPLGTCLDLADAAGGARRRPAPNARPAPLAWPAWGRATLLALVAGAALGVNWSFLVAPLALLARVLALAATPMLAVLGSTLLDPLRGLLAEMGLESLASLPLAQPRQATLWIQALTLTALLGASAWGTRLWCRCLCPAGALLGVAGGLFGRRRRVTAACTRCGVCQRACPMAAIPQEPRQTRHAGCIACETCAAVCPATAVSFGWTGPATAVAPAPDAGRRRFLRTGVAGLGAGLGIGVTASLAARGELHSPHVPAGVGELPDSRTIRPPGALPEPLFLDRCLRCGLCLRACPTNTLQALGLEAGVSGLFSPAVTPRRGPCEPECHVCGLVCPTAAILPLPLEEKQAVKLGSARVRRERCVAWEEDKACLVCDEACPYDAIELVRLPGHAVGLPVVREERCAGCGFCEFHCPVRAERAIVVEPAGASRLEDGAYLDENRARGLDIRLARHRAPDPTPDHGGYPGDSSGDPSGEAAPGGLPPGFSDPDATP